MSPTSLYKYSKYSFVSADEESNAYSHLLLALKAWSNALPRLALTQVDKALELDPLLGLAQLLKALLAGYVRECAAAYQELRKIQNRFYFVT